MLSGSAGAARISSADRWTFLTAGVLLALVGVVCVTFRDYGITHDEFVQHTYGELLWNFYLSGFQDRHVFDYIDLFRYGGLFDLVATALAPHLPFDHYETRHLLSALSGILGIAGTGCVAARLAGARAGCIATVMLALTASYYGSMFNNTKDIPFAAGMIWTLYYAIRLIDDLPRPRWSSVFAFGTAFGLTIGVRVGVMMIPAYLVAGMAIWAWGDARQMGATAARRTIWVALIRLMPGALLAYAIMAVCWPWGVLEPLNPLRALAFFSHHPAVIPSQIFGIHATSAHTLWYYIPGYLLVKLPELTLIAFALGLVVIGQRAIRAPNGLRAQLLVLIMAAVVPLVLFVVFHPTVFNGLRHFFFVVPPITVVAALALDEVWKRASQRGRLWTAGLAVVLALVWSGQVRVIVALHPDQYVYYNSIVGGAAGAQDRFEMDYWSNSIREAALKLTDRVRAETGGKAPARPYKVALCSEYPSFFEYVPPGWFEVADNWTEGDFFVAPTQMGCDRALDGDLMFVVERMGARLSVVKDRRRILRH